MSTVPAAPVVPSRQNSAIDPKRLKVPVAELVPLPNQPPSPFPRASPPSPVPSPVQETIKPNETVDLSNVTNAEFIAAVFHQIPEEASAAICSKPGDPTEGGWPAVQAIAADIILNPEDNNYVACSCFQSSIDSIFSVMKKYFVALFCLMFDDIGTKIPKEKFAGIALSWLIETSPGNFQGGIILSAPITDIEEAERLQKTIIAAGLCDAGASGVGRWARLPNAINGKAKYRDADGKPFQCRLAQWQPDKRYTVQEIVDGLKLELDAIKPQLQIMHRRADDVLTPKATENPVVSALKALGLYKKPLGSGKHDISCPWRHEHTDTLDTGAAYFEPDDEYPVGGFCCMHSHRDSFHILQLLEFLGIANTEARHRAVIRIVAGELHRVIDSAEEQLANLGRHFQAGSLIVSVVTDVVTGDPTILPTGLSALTRQLSIAAIWEQFNARLGWVRCDPPTRHTSILLDTKEFRYLPALAGVARQPYFRECDGELVMESGYDKESKMFGVFDPRQFPIPEPTLDAARNALMLLENLIAEFHFLSKTDKAAAISAIFTAVVRPTLAHAPAYHVKAPVFGSGKSYLCELIGAFAGPGLNAKVSYPVTSEEATKAIISLLLKNLAVIEFDDMSTDWTPHGVLLRALTAEQITDRILGYSKTATVSTRSLFLGSGNNVGPVRDMLRRVLTINIDPRCATPATIKYHGNPLDEVRQNRGKYVAAVLTIILAWRKHGSPKTACESIVTYGGAWSEYCRQPLMWLGYPDPATALIEQIQHDPDADALGKFLLEWHRAFGSIPTTVRKAVDTANFTENLMDALKEFPVEERGSINRSKLGWVLKKNANRIVNGLEIQQAEADGRTAWKVVMVKSGSASPVSPALSIEVPVITNIDDPF